LKVVGALASLFGLSSAIFTQLYVVTLKPHLTPFFLVIVIVAGVASLFGLIFVNSIPKESTEDIETLIPSEPEPEVNMHLLKILPTFNWWLLLITVFCVTGAGLMLINNIGNAVLSLGGADGSQVGSIRISY
jgi:hypothetical protein